MSDERNNHTAKTRTLVIEGVDPIVRVVLSQAARTFTILLYGVLIVVSLPLLWAIKENTFVKGGLDIDALHDFGYWNQAVILLPFMLWFMRHYFGGLENALRELQKQKAVEKTDKEFLKFAEGANALFKQRWVTWSPYWLGMGIVVVCYLTFLGANRNTWNSPPGNPLAHLTVWLSIPPTFLLYLVLGQFVARVACLWGVIKLFMKDEAKVHINPLHPDGAGGLAPLGTFSFRVLPGCLVGGICTLVGALVNVGQYHLPALHPANLLMFVGYAFALSVVFFLPLYAARGQMKKAKASMLMRIGQKCNTLVCEAVEDIEGEPKSASRDLKEIETQNSRMKQRVESIENVNKLYEVADRMPIYPFDAKTVFGFFTSVFWPPLLWTLKEGYSILKAHYGW